MFSSLPDDNWESILETITKIDKFTENYQKEKLLNKHVFGNNNLKDIKSVNEPTYHERPDNEIVPIEEFRKGIVKECVVQNGNIKELNKVVKDGVMKKNTSVDGLNVCNTQYVWETGVTNPKKEIKNICW